MRAALLSAFLSSVFPIGLDIAAHAEPRTTEYDVKAAFLYNFVKFAEWPAGAFGDEEGPIVIGIFGHDPFGAELDRMLEKKTAHGRRFEVRRLLLPSDAAKCHVLFVANASTERLPSLIEAIGARPVLIVGESRGFALRGGHVNFLVEKNRVLFEINVEQSAAASLKFSSQLLKLARVVSTASARRDSDG